MLKNSGKVRSWSEVSGLMKSIVAGRGRCGPPEELRKRLRCVACLDLLHIIEVVGVEKLCAKTGEGEFRLAAKDFLDARWLRAFPTGTGDEEAAAVIACGAAANVAEIEGIKVNQLNGEISARLN